MAVVHSYCYELLATLFVKLVLLSSHWSPLLASLACNVTYVHMYVCFNWGEL